MYETQLLTPFMTDPYYDSDSDSVSLYSKEGRIDAKSLRPGVQVWCAPDQAGRHLGEAIEEYIREL